MFWLANVIIGVAALPKITTKSFQAAVIHRILVIIISMTMETAMNLFSTMRIGIRLALAWAAVLVPCPGATGSAWYSARASDAALARMLAKPMAAARRT